MESLRQNTAKVQFQKTDPKPTDQEMMRFVLNNGLTSKDVHTLYQDLYDRCIYIKFNAEQKYLEFVSDKNVLNFNYTNGATTQVTVKGASGVMRYVRVFNLPPEITDKTLNEAMHRFGNIISTRREKFGANSLLPVFSGVRGVCIEMEREIPQFIYIQNIKARIFYDGMRERCFKCGDETHKKQDCPLLHNTSMEILPQRLQQQAPQSQPEQCNQIDENHVQQQSDHVQHTVTNDQDTVHTTNNHERAKYSDIAKITKLHEQAENKIETIKKMINLREHIKVKSQETDSSCMDTENEDVSVMSKRGRPAKKGRYTSTKNRVAVIDQLKNLTTSTNKNNNNLITSQLPPTNLNNADRTE